MSKEEEDLVRKLQARADAMVPEPIPILLSDQPGPYQLPLCTQVAVGTTDSGMVQLILDAQSGQRILLPMPADVAASLGRTLAFVLTPRKE